MAKTATTKLSKQAKPKPQAKPKAKPAKKRKGSKQKGKAAAGSSICSKCGSSERAPYSNELTREITGVDPKFGPYTRVTWRTTKCLGCGQHRRDVERVNQPAKRKRPA